MSDEVAWEDRRCPDCGLPVNPGDHAATCPHAQKEPHVHEKAKDHDSE